MSLVATSRAAYASALGLLAAGGLLGLVAAGRVWSVAVVDVGLGPQSYPATGRDLAPLAAAGALVALAGVLAVAATRRAGRVLVGGVLAVVGAAQVAAGLAWVSPSADRLAPFVASASGVGGGVPARVTQSVWPVALAAAGLLVLAGGVLVAWRGSGWPALGGRYDTPTARPAGSPDQWAALDRGEDPTR